MAIDAPEQLVVASGGAEKALGNNYAIVRELAKRIRCNWAKFCPHQQRDKASGRCGLTDGQEIGRRPLLCLHILLPVAGGTEEGRPISIANCPPTLSPISFLGASSRRHLYTKGHLYTVAIELTANVQAQWLALGRSSVSDQERVSFRASGCIRRPH